MEWIFLNEFEEYFSLLKMFDLMLGITLFSQAEDMVERTKNGKTLT